MTLMRFPARSLSILCLLLAASVVGLAAAATITASIGDIVPLSGTATGRDQVYLFMIGPGVPSQGSRMDSSISPVVTGEADTFTIVPVDGYTSHWNYSWNTGRVSGGLAEGHYTVYSATQPASKNDLAGVPYATIAVDLFRPVTTASLMVTSSPARAQVSLNGKYSGDTPLTLSSLAPGTYRIDCSLSGFPTASQTLTLAAGDQQTIHFDLQPTATVTATPTSSPSEPPVQTTGATPTPTRAALSIPGAFLGLLICLYLGYFRK